MPLKRKPTPIPDGNTLVIRLQNTLGFSVDETAKSILAASKPLFEPQNNQTSTNAED